MFKAETGMRRHCGVWLADTSALLAQGGASRHHHLHHHPAPLHSALSFLLAVNGTLLATVEPTVETPPATADTPPFTSPTPIEGTVVTADLVISRLLPPTQATPPTAAPTTPLVTLKRPPVTRHTTPGGAATWSLPESENKSITRDAPTVIFILRWWISSFFTIRASASETSNIQHSESDHWVGRNLKTINVCSDVCRVLPEQ